MLLYGAFATHLTLALVGLHQRHTLLLPPSELLRIGFGLTIPLLQIGHVVSTRVAYSWYGEAAHYRRVIANLASSGGTGWQLALLAPGWLHGCMGLNLAFRHRAWYAPRRGWLIGAVVALPLLAAAGYWSMTRDVEALNLPAAQRVTPADPAQRRALGELREHLLTGYFGLLALMLAARSVRDWRDGRRTRATR